MKIEIELSEVEYLKEQVAYKDKEISELEGKLKSLNEKELKEKAVNLSKWLFSNYMDAVFKGLGFSDTWSLQAVNFPNNLEHHLGNNWWSNERVVFEVSANVRGHFKRAYLDIGINPDIPKKEDTLEWVTEETNSKT